MLGVHKGGQVAGRPYHYIVLSRKAKKSGKFPALDETTCHLVPVLGSLQAAIGLLHYQTGTNLAGVGIRVRDGKLFINARWRGKKRRILVNLDCA